MVVSLPIESIAPDFTLSDDSGNQLNLYEALKNGPVILAFYPKSFTAGCTAEVCAFRNEYPAFRDLGIQIFGISHDTTATLARFGQKYQLPFRLLSDPGRWVCRDYKALYPFGFFTKRITYLIDRDKRIKGVFQDLTQAEKHVSKMKILARQLEPNKG